MYRFLDFLILGVIWNLELYIEYVPNKTKTYEERKIEVNEILKKLEAGVQEVFDSDNYKKDDIPYSTVEFIRYNKRLSYSYSRDKGEEMDWYLFLSVHFFI